MTGAGSLGGGSLTSMFCVDFNSLFFAFLPPNKFEKIFMGSLDEDFESVDGSALGGGGLGGFGFAICDDMDDVDDTAPGGGGAGLVTYFILILLIN